MKKLIQAILMAVFMILLVIPQAVQAQEYSSEQDYYQAVQDNQRVYDFAELLSDSERENIEEKISDASEQSGLDIVVLTVNQMFGKTDREMADDFYDNGQFGFELEGKEIFINTGSTPILPDIDGLKNSRYVYTSDTLLHTEILPQHLLIIGSGAIGLEFATMYAGFGSKVTILEAGKRFLPKADREIAEYMQESLKRKNIEIRLNARVQSLHDTADGITAAYTDASDGTPYFLEGDALLIATGRKPMIDDLNLEKAKIQVNAQGGIIVNEQLRTTAPHVWALGDAKGGEMYDYLSIDDSRIILNHLFGNKERSVDDRNPVPYAIFTDPPMAHIGLTEEEAMKRGYPIKISRLPASAIPRARTLQNMDGMLKAIVNTDTKKILGCSLFCVDAPELINLVAFVMKTGQKSSALRNFIFTHPSMSEGLNGLFKAF